MTLKQAKNEVNIEGILSEVNIAAGATKDGREYIRGEIKILVDQPIGDKTITSLVPVRMFAMKRKRDGGVNPAYEAIERVQNEYRSAAAVGDISEADAVSINSGTLNENIFIPRGQNKEVSFVEIQSNFINKINRSNMNPITRFSTTIAINGISEEIKDDEPTGALIVRGSIIQYNEKIDIIDFKVYDNEAKAHIERHWNKGDTVNIEGYINFSSKTVYVEDFDENSFGEPIKVPRTYTSRELIIVKGSAEPYEEEFAYSKDELNEALKKRLARIEELKKPKAPAVSNDGF